MRTESMPVFAPQPEQQPDYAPVAPVIPQQESVGRHAAPEAVAEPPATFRQRAALRIAERAVNYAEQPHRSLGDRLKDRVEQGRSIAKNVGNSLVSEWRAVYPKGTTRQLVGDARESISLTASAAVSRKRDLVGNIKIRAERIDAGIDRRVDAILDAKDTAKEAIKDGARRHHLAAKAATLGLAHELGAIPAEIKADFKTAGRQMAQSRLKRAENRATKLRNKINGTPAAPRPAIQPLRLA